MLDRSRSLLLLVLAAFAVAGGVHVGGYGSRAAGVLPPIVRVGTDGSAGAAVLAAEHRRAREAGSGKGGSPAGTSGRPETPHPAVVRRWVAALIDDDVRGNATESRERLIELGPDAVPALREALRTTDAQQRLYVVHLLAQLEAPIDEDLLRAAALALEDDPWHTDFVHDDTDAVRLLIRAGARAWPEARPGLHARDPQRRFLSAVVLAHTRCPHDLALTVTVLAGHLRDNRWRDDAAIASRALFALGPPAREHLEGLLGMGGLQARRLVKLVLRELEDPSPDPRAAFERATRLAPGPHGGPLVSWRFQRDHFFGLDARSR